MEKRGQSETKIIFATFGIITIAVMILVFIGLQERAISSPEFNKAYLDEQHEILKNTAKSVQGDLKIEVGTGNSRLEETGFVKIRQTMFNAGDKYVLKIEKKDEKLESRTVKK